MNSSTAFRLASRGLFLGAAVCAGLALWTAWTYATQAESSARRPPTPTGSPELDRVSARLAKIDAALARQYARNPDITDGMYVALLSERSRLGSEEATAVVDQIKKRHAAEQAEAGRLRWDFSPLTTGPTPWLLGAAVVLSTLARIIKQSLAELALGPTTAAARAPG